MTDIVVTMSESDSELLNLLAKRDENEVEGLTSYEIARLLGWGYQKTMHRLNEQIAKGNIKCIIVYRKYNTGSYNKKPVYVRT